MREITYLQAISDAISHEMERDPEVLVLGEDVGGDFGGAFKVTQGLAARFGDRRVLNTPIAELSFIGMATGMALMGLRPIIEMQFADFISTGFDSNIGSRHEPGSSFFRTSPVPTWPEPVQPMAKVAAGEGPTGGEFRDICSSVHRSGRGPMEGSIKAYGRAVPGLLR